MRKVLFVVGLLVICLSLNVTNSYAAGVGTNGAQFLRINMGARPTAMGGAFVAVSDDANAPYWNPAGLGKLEKREMSTSLVSLFPGVICGNLNYIEPTTITKVKDEVEDEIKIGTFGFGLIYLTSNGMDKTEITPGGALTETDETFSASDMAIMLSYGKEVKKKISVGANIKLINNRIERETASAVSMDLGMMLKGENNMQFGMALQNVVRTAGTFSQDKYSLPFNAKLGGAAKFMDNTITVALDINLPIASYASIAIGGEYLIPTDNIEFAIRAGCNTATMGDLGMASGITAGFGLRLLKGESGIDYAFAPFGDLGMIHRLSLMFKL